MDKKLDKKALAAAVGSVFVVSLATAPIASADSNPFGMSELSSGYMQVADSHMGKGKEGQCGEGKCGGEKAKKEGQCGEGKAAKEGQCGEGKPAKEGQCGGEKAKKEGNCGGKEMPKGKEGQCGEGKCGAK
jgi:uncharacterized low-complexity protein